MVSHPKIFMSGQRIEESLDNFAEMQTAISEMTIDI